MTDIRELNDADLDGVSGAGPAVASKAAAMQPDTKAAALAAATKPTTGSVAGAVGAAPSKGALQAPATLVGNVTKDVAKAAAALQAVPASKGQGKG